MSTGNDKLNEVFNCEVLDKEEYITLPIPPVMHKTSVPKMCEDDIDDDIDFSRKMLISLSQKSQQLVDLALTSAAEEPSPRDIEVTAKAIESAVGTVDRLLGMQKAAKELRTKDLGSGNTFINNQNVTYKSTADMIDEL